MIKNKKIHILLLLIIFFFIHINFFDVNKQNRNLESETDIFGDYGYYLSGALSIYEYNDLNIKFNNKKQPITASPKVNFSEKENKYKFVSFLYPYPSFKFGYSLFSAIITWPFDQDIFKFKIYRLAFVNFILGAFILILIFLSLINLNFNNISIYSVCLLYIFDNFNIFNNYQYQSHTLIGLFFAALSYYIFLKEPKKKNNFFWISFFLCFGILSSSHTLILSMSLGLMIWLNYIHKKNLEEKIKISMTGFCGVLIFPVYIIFVEKFFNFKEKMLPGYFGQFKHYSNTVGNLIDTYPIFQRNLWSFDIWNPFIKYFVLLVFLYFLIIFFINKKIHIKENINLSLNQLYNILIVNKSVIFLFPSFLFILSIAFYSQPITRAMVPIWFIFNIVFGCTIGLIHNKKIKNFCFITLIILLSANFYLSQKIYTESSLSKPETSFYYTIPSKPKNAKNIILLNEHELIWKKTEYYFKGDNYKTINIPGGNLGDYSIDLKSYINFLKKKISKIL